MSMNYEPSRRPKSSLIGSHHVDAPAGARAGLPDDAKEYGVCPRPFCGGLIVRRMLVTWNGDCEELVCVSCSRARPVRMVEPYQAMRAERSATVERMMAPRVAPSRGGGAEVEGAEIPRAIRRVMREA